MRRLMTALAVLALVLAGCTAGSGESGGSDAAMAESGAGVVAEEPAGDDAGGAGGTEEGAGVGVVTDVDAARQVVTEGSVTLTVEDPRMAARDAAALVEQAGGHVQERVEQAGEDPTEVTAWLVVRIPADGLTRTLQELERLGRVDSVELSTDDVTAQAQDLDARIRALQISVTRLEDLLSRAQSSSDVVAAERSLTERQSDLEALVAQRDRLADRVDMSTVRLQFLPQDGAPAPARAGFGGGLATGWESLGTALSVALHVLGVLLPWVLVAGVVGLAAVALRRRLRRHRTTGGPAAGSGALAP